MKFVDALGQKVDPDEGSWDRVEEDREHLPCDLAGVMCQNCLGPGIACGELAFECTGMDDIPEDLTLEDLMLRALEEDE